MKATWEDIVAIVRHRQLARLPILRQMMDVRQRYNAEWVLPYPTDEDAPDLPPTTPLLIAESIDHLGMQAGSVMPYIGCPPLRMGKQTGIESRDWADRRRVSLHAMWRTSRGGLQLRRAYRHMAGYASTALSVMLDDHKKIPVFQARDPLSTYPEEKAPEDVSPLGNCAFIHGKSRDWLRRAFPESRLEAGGIVPAEAVGEEVLWDVVEWVDDEQCVVGILGPRNWYTRQDAPMQLPGQSGSGMLLRAYPNYAGRCTVVTPRAVTLDRVVSQIATLTGTVDLLGKLQALSVLATEKAIYPDRYVIGSTSGAPELVDGEWHDGRTGKTNLIKNAAQVGELRSTPDPSNQQTIDRMERAYRTSVGLVPQRGGETYGAMRTGRAIDSLYGVAVDPRIEEMHGILAPDLEEIHALGLDLWRNHPDCAGRTYTVFSGSAFVEVQPDRHIETTENCVKYPVPGADAQGTTIQLGQLVGAGLMSKMSAAELHPLIDNPETERRRMLEEVLEEAALQALVNKAQSGEIPLEMLAYIEEASRDEPDIFSAFRAAQDKVRSEQAAEPPAPPEGLPAPPEMQPGMEGLPAPAGQLPALPPGPPLPNQGPGPGAIGPTDNQVGLRDLVEALSQRGTAPAEGPAA